MSLPLHLGEAGPVLPVAVLEVAPEPLGHACGTDELVPRARQCSGSRSS